MRRVHGPEVQRAGDAGEHPAHHALDVLETAIRLSERELHLRQSVPEISRRHALGELGMAREPVAVELVDDAIGVSAHRGTHGWAQAQCRIEGLELVCRVELVIDRAGLRLLHAVGLAHDGHHPFPHGRLLVRELRARQRSFARREMAGESFERVAGQDVVEAHETAEQLRGCLGQEVR